MINEMFLKAFNPYVKDLKKFEKIEIEMDKITKNTDLYNIKDSIFSLFNINDVSYYVGYVFSKIKKWINENEEYSEYYINSLEKIIVNNGVQNKLGSYEIEYINHVKAVVFAKERNLKKLIVDFPLESFKIQKRKWMVKKINEIVYYKFEKISLLDFDSFFKPIQTKHNLEINLSNHRIIFNSSAYIFSINYKKIIKYKLDGNSTLIYVNHDGIIKIYRLIANDNFVFYVSFERMLRFWQNHYC